VVTKLIGTIVLIQFFCGLVPIAFIWLLPSNKQIDDFYSGIRKNNDEITNLVKKKP